MKTNEKKPRNTDLLHKAKKQNRMLTALFTTLVLLWVVMVLGAGCSGRLSEHFTSDKAGLNGGFEVVESGLPVNWLLYTHNTVPDADFDVLVDEEEMKSGKRSLKYVVRDCSDTGGWRSPGFCRELEAKPGVRYQVQFWARQDGGAFTFQLGGVTAKRGDYAEKQVISETSDQWKQYTYTYKMPEAFDRLRLEWNAIQTGQYWIDDLTVKEVSEKHFNAYPSFRFPGGFQGYGAIEYQLVGGGIF